MTIVLSAKVSLVSFEAPAATLPYSVAIAAPARRLQEAPDRCISRLRHVVAAHQSTCDWTAMDPSTAGLTTEPISPDLRPVTHTSPARTTAIEHT